MKSGSGEQITRIQNYKGVFFIFLTSGLLYLMCNYYYKKQRKIIQSSHQNSERLNTMLESITDGFFAVDRNGIITHINQACARLFGGSRETFVGKKLWTLFPDYTDSRSYREYSRALKENVTVHFEDYLAPYEAWFEVNAYPFQKGLAVYFRDITQQKLIRRELMVGKSSLDALINNTSDLIWSVDRDCRLLSFNKPFRDMMKYFLPDQEIQKGMRLAFPTVSAKDVAEDWMQYYQRALEGEQFTVEYFSKPAGQVFYTETSFNPIFNEQQEIIGVGCFSRDIGHHKKTEEERKLLIQRLVNQNKDLEEFSFIASHNLRSPVASILGLLQIYNKQEPSDPHNEVVMENLKKTAGKLDEIIVDLAQILDIRYRLEEAKEQVSFDSIIDTIKSMLSYHIVKNNAVLETDFAVPQVDTVKSYLTNILFNLISNSIKYRKEETTPVVRISTEESEDYVLIKVKDNGVGLDLEKHEQKLFMPYKRFHNHVSGKGIGLYLVKSQVEALQGMVKVESSPGAGTTLFIYLKTFSKTPVVAEECTNE
ncbi:MAG TPA: PAS domain-containing sensor histidine kinase [Cytophagaceae bacterium]|nr:PAS domain-containing sensor histidine kinase [Cytophagaceae bacterium]